MADLKTTYKDDVLNTSANEKRKYNMITNEDGTVSLVDVTDYSQVGDSFGSADINATNEKVNELNTNLHYQYSASEVDTGRKWVDGKPIYRKCYDDVVLTTNNTCIIDNTLTYAVVDKVITCKGFVLRSDYSNGSLIPFYAIESGNALYINLSINSNGFNVQSYNYDMTSSKCTFIIEYTKK